MPNPNKQEYISTLVGMWEVQETLLQQYRAIFITMQSIFIAVAAAIMQGGGPKVDAGGTSPAVSAKMILLGEGPWIPMLLLSVLAWYTLRWLWLPICRARGRTVYLIQFLILKAETDVFFDQPLRTVKDFHDKEQPEIEGDPLFRSLDGGETRKKMEHYLPNMFILAWFFLWLTLILQNFYVAVGPR